MSVKKFFWEDPYRTTLDAKVTSVTDNVITVDRTIAVAFSGGQASDCGTINGYNIIRAEKVGKEIFYTLDGEHDIDLGDEVIIVIDWEKRYRIMKLHFAAEIILELVYQNFGYPEKIGANISDTKARVDFVWNGNISETFSFLYSEANRLIELNLPITSDFSNVEAEKRYWEVLDFGKVSCGGTHLKTTGEIGPIKLKRDNIGKNKERIEITMVNP
ncbi:alanyl-tRNA synthetase [Desulfosporosinus sp. HMP52]|uniref:alanyl-tRNA editing protein n=1 Tax=Desulfosporosinus sp. HMP52 TaxID=1487923 RepID=UPI00051FF105|nr:alanyl-tRNA editing protein [Desulfosporosinus sp. HMP52]KGK91871.1 alanyl-tRNA synthetase [Desulfosporosinus sp. HMP52]